MKTTLNLPGPLLARAKAHARKTHQTLTAVVEEGLRHVLDATPARRTYVMKDASVGKAGAPNPLEGMSWQDLRDEIYGRG